ncbi:hypothetical protein IB237_18635 [Agrobacterium sp. AGB01]|uniref:hypothetical protein n=1 Tax=Agrobacterium sp. AGB01 TaxID=2769302 RepID=UPI00178076B1|nr:hypothetical protein [Agrobacterium sp. AGB01]MBD9389207.1 hypothetical protein [Agrobacterium sp. AGB01]
MTNILKNVANQTVTDEGSCKPTITIEEKQQSAAKSLSPTEAKWLSGAFRSLDPKPRFLSREMVEHNAL